MQCLVGRINLSDHPNNPKLKVGVIHNKTVVVGDHYDNYTLGFYIPVGAIVPDKLAEEMWVKGRLAGPKKNQVVAKIMKDVFSEGLFYGSRFWTLQNGNVVYQDSASWNPDWIEGYDVANELGITFAKENHV